MVLSVGRLVREKGIYELLDSLSLVFSQNPRGGLVLVGSDPIWDETTEILRKVEQCEFLRARTKIRPKCEPAKVWDYLSAADIFAFPSHREGMPNSLLEAMAVGLPAVAAAIPPVREVEAGTGALVLVEPGNQDRFAREVLRLMQSSPLRAEIGEKAKREVGRRFLMKKNLQEALDRIVSLIHERTLEAAGSRH